MTIKDIAKLSGVSVSTVSKIMNNKADSIAEQTKLKVLRIAREQRYTPYAAVKNGLNGRHYRLAVIAPLDRRNLPVIRRLEAAAHERGYQMILADSLAGGRPAAGQLAALRGASDGAIFVGEGAAPEPRGWPAVVIGSAASPTRPAVAADWGAAARAAAEHLESLGHRRLGLLSADDQAWPGSAVRASVERHYGERERPFDRKLSVTPATLPTLISAGATAVICVGQDLARLFYQYAWRQDLAIPQDVSVAALDDGDPEPFWPPLTVARLSADELARRALETLIAQIEGRAPDLPAAAAAPLLSPAESTAAPASRAGSAASILVVGSLNLDVMMSVPMMPSSGETVLIDDLSSLPGGKGANQAVAVARLGGEVSLIGRIGRDAGGKTVYNALRLHRVDTRGVSVDRQVETGRAYINVSPGGESFIEVYGGANRRLAPRHLERNEDLFRTASYCLIQSELPVEIFGLAVEFASRHGAKVIFKPCSLDQLPADLLKKIYLLVPTRKEAARL
ncbi:MAG: PfkB family carbohydrate kinase, partial [Deltaproteobacteria bacterium]|nr:PfkB family carbohydrate kinase [Deltaproteobacteria bacterium]